MAERLPSLNLVVTRWTAQSTAQITQIVFVDPHYLVTGTFFVHGADVQDTKCMHLVHVSAVMP